MIHTMTQSYNPSIAVTTLVWAIPRSLATTYGITFVFFSSRYLDVSVPWVCLLADTMSSTQWVAPFGYLRINLYVPIPATFRSLSRPSSPLRAQAFPIRPYFAYVPPYTSGTWTCFSCCLINKTTLLCFLLYFLLLYLNMSMNVFPFITT